MLRLSALFTLSFSASPHHAAGEQYQSSGKDLRKSSNGSIGSGDGGGPSGVAAESLPAPRNTHAAASVVPERHLPSSASVAQLDSILRIKQQIDNSEWDADLLTLCDLLHNPMAFIVHLVLQQWDALEALSTEEATLTRLLEHIEGGYKPTNPYHNATHAADVAYTTHCMLHHGVRAALDLSDLQCAVCILAAAAHDFRHPGIGANYLIAMGDDLALTYNDRSPLESMHTSQFFKLLKAKPDANVFSALPTKEMADVRKCIVGMILATDMSVHFDYLDRFQKKFHTESALDEMRLEKSWADDQSFAMAMLLHCADISNPAKPRDTYLNWTDRVLGEFYHQGDLEAKASLAISTFYDRSKPSVGKMQAGFIQFIVRPIFTAWCEFVPELKGQCMHHIEANAAIWKATTPFIPPEQIYVHGDKVDWDWERGRWITQ